LIKLAEFIKQLSKIESGLWKAITAQDRRWPSAKVTEVQQSPVGLALWAAATARI
jgi:hypothetical protein